MKKSEFKEKWQKIFKIFPVNSQITGSYSDFIWNSLIDSNYLKDINNLTNPVFKVKNMKIANGRRIKMVFQSQNSYELPIPLGKILDKLYPPKKRDNINPSKVHSQQVRIALRNLIDVQIKEFRNTLKFPFRCPLTSKLVFSNNDIDIDHVVPLIQLIEDWLELNSLYYDDLGLKGPKNNKVLSDIALSLSFQTFHLHKAHLQAVSRSANRSMGCKDFKTSSRLNNPNISDDVINL